MVDALLPNRADRPLEELAFATFIDDDVDVAVCPVDQLLMALARRLLTDESLGHVALVQLPRATHRTALLLAITSHLLCRQAPTRFSGPVILIGLDVNLVAQLRAMSVRGHRRMGLADGNPLSAHRLTRAGTAEPLIGSSPRPVDHSLVYFNTRVGSPTLACSAPLVVLDATSVEHPAARARALQWALSHGAAAVLVVGDVGDDGLFDTMAMGSNPITSTVCETNGPRPVRENAARCQHLL